MNEERKEPIEEPSEYKPEGPPTTTDWVALALIVFITMVASMFLIFWLAKTYLASSPSSSGSNIMLLFFMTGDMVLWGLIFLFIEWKRDRKEARKYDVPEIRRNYERRL